MTLAERFRLLLDEGLEQASVLEILGEISPREALRDKAKEAYQSDDIEIDARPLFSDSALGVWVSAWVWIDTNED